MQNKFEARFINKEIGETIMSTDGTVSSDTMDQPVGKIPRVIEISNTVDNKNLFFQLNDVKNGTFNLEIEGIKAGKFSLLKDENVIRLIEVVE